MPAIARVGDTHDCPLHGANAITTGSGHEMDGRAIATVGDSCDCGGTITSGSSVAEIGGQAVAYLGSSTSCGGTITSGSAKGNVPV
jgi:uncharacterized Zn-binding protein involved in type VI secretion